MGVLFRWLSSPINESQDSHTRRCSEVWLLQLVSTSAKVSSVHTPTLCSAHFAVVPIICNGGGTAHKPRHTDAAGFALSEAQLMAKVLIHEHGCDQADVFQEGHSDGTIGNAFMYRAMHTEWRAWRRLLLTTSDFQLARAEADCLKPEGG